MIQKTYKQTIEVDVPVGYYLKNVNLHTIQPIKSEYYIGGRYVTVGTPECELKCHAQIFPIVPEPTPKPCSELPIGVYVKIFRLNNPCDELIGYKTSNMCFMLAKCSENDVQCLYDIKHLKEYYWLPLDEKA